MRKLTKRIGVIPIITVASETDSRQLGWVKVPSVWLLRGDTVVSTVEATRQGDLLPPRLGDCEPAH